MRSWERVLTTLRVVVGVGGEGAIHAAVGNGNDEVAGLVDLSAGPEAGGEVGSVTEELCARSGGGGGRAGSQADGLDGVGGSAGDGEDEAEKSGGELHS